MSTCTIRVGRYVSIISVQRKSINRSLVSVLLEIRLLIILHEGHFLAKQYAPPEVTNGIIEARKNIYRIKEVLRVECRGARPP